MSATAFVACYSKDIHVLKARAIVSTNTNWNAYWEILGYLHNLVKDENDNTIRKTIYTHLTQEVRDAMGYSRAVICNSKLIATMLFIQSLTKLLRTSNMFIQKLYIVLTLLLFTYCTDAAYTTTVNAPVPTVIWGSTARVKTARALLDTNGGQVTILKINGVNGYNIVSVLCNTMETYYNSSPIYSQVSLAGQYVDTNGGYAQCVWVNNGGGRAQGYVSADVVFVKSSLS